MDHDDERAASTEGSDGARRTGAQPGAARLTRRGFLGTAAAAGTAAVAFGALTGGADATPAGPATGPVPFPTPPVQGTTFDTTLLPGKPGAGGYRHLYEAAGEPTLPRTDLCAAAPGGRLRPLLSFGHLTDMHLIDAQSPARVEFLDRYDDPGSPYAAFLPFQSVYRGWEMLTTQVADAMVASMNRVGRGPVTGTRLAFSIATGDNADNTQYNELRWQIDLLDGETVRPDSGDYTKYEGVADRTVWSPYYWHPDGPPPNQTPDYPTARYGFPTVPGLLDACRQPFKATGLATPWFTAFGNHDGLVQGNLPGNALFNAVATGSTKIVDLPPNTDIIALAQGLQTGSLSALQTLFSGPSRTVTADPNRRLLNRVETVAEYFKTTGRPHGHGYTKQNLADETAYYGFDRGVVRGIVLDTVNPYGGADGSIDSTQLAWLTAELTAGSRRYLDESGQWVTGTATRDRLFVLFSHHTIATMTNLVGAGRVGGSDLLQLLLRFPNVVLWVNGHTHKNQVTPHPRTAPAATAAPGGFWEVNTAAHVDWPQQSRILELADNGNGTMSIFSTIIDHAAPYRSVRPLTSRMGLASLARELSANDYQEPDVRDARRGEVDDRNVQLLVPSPFPLS